MSTRSISVDVDVDVDEIISDLSTKDLIEELETRSDWDGLSLSDYIERISGRIIQSFTDEELADWVISRVRKGK